jgi:RNA polymerase sigma-70 factor (sigma-E family)
VERILDEGSSPGGGGGSSFVDFYRAEYPGIVRLAHALTGNAETAEDVSQEAFARILNRIDDIENPGGYLRTIVVNLVRDRERRWHREHRTGPPSWSEPSLGLEASEMIDVLLRLPYRQRATLVLRYWADWSEVEIAEALGCRSGTVKTLASRGLARLRKEIAP